MGLGFSYNLNENAYYIACLWISKLIKKHQFFMFSKNCLLYLVQFRYNDKILSIYKKTENMGDLYEW